MTLSFITGCEKDESAADRRVSENIQAARETYYKKDGGPEKSHKLLEAAARETTASNASKATSKALVGQSNYALAISHLPELNAAEAEALRVVREINRIGSELGDEVFLIDSLKGSNPSAGATDPLKALSANKAKFAAQVAELDKTIQQLQTKRQELISKIASLDTEQKSKVEMGNALLQKSEAAKGQESVDLFKQSADVRRSASMLARDLEFARLDLKRTESLITDTQNERKVAEDSAKIAQDQIQQLNQGWAAAEDAIKKRRAEASGLLTRAEVDGSVKKGINAESGIAALAKQFAAAKQRAADARKNIDETNLEPSIAAYDEADKSAKRLGDDLRQQLQDEKNKDTPVRVAWQRIQRLYNPATYRLGKARSLQLRGQLFLQERNLLKAQQYLVAALQPLFQRAGLTLPPEIAPTDLAAQFDTAQKNALRDLSDSYAVLKDILELDDVQRNTWPQANEARELAVTVEYALHHLEPDKGHLDSAKGTVKLLSDAGANFPALPPDLETRQINPVPIVAAGKGPTTNPAEGAPSGGPAITPEGAAALKNLLNRARGGGGAAPQPPPPQQNQ
ncbi:MAG TPA: hypothetical protein VGP94_04155 [Tepidisphaeraceae bacterium]|nr:hypothetical protein [Tepidisphaeraceae bacterium]